ncbi:orotidine-5'-phosphate decarboxylase [Candidatus Parcubacteria bacterium]|nr:orotidine-5'-phosphate decarboxylase [Candidatus Parcubacteria bacterium]
MTFYEKLQAGWEDGRFLCVGLDPDPALFPEHLLWKGHVQPERVEEFCRKIVDATGNVALAFKPNTAFFERMGEAGHKVLLRLCRIIRRDHPQVVLILDANRANIGKSGEGDAAFAFDQADADAVTVSPYLGRDACEPFLSRTDRGTILLCRTSNPWAGEFQNRLVIVNENEREFAREFGDISLDFQNGRGCRAVRLYRLIAYTVARAWNNNRNCGLVVAATYPNDLAVVRQIVGNGFPLLIPGIGRQGGEIEATVRAGRDRQGQGMIINASSGIIHASRGENYAEVAYDKAMELHKAIRALLR